MSINIKRSSSKPSPLSTGKSTSGQKPKKASAASSNSGSSKTTSSDSLELTGEGTQLQQIEQSLSEIPIIDSKRVESVSQSIENGQYTIDNEKIADRIIKNERDLKGS
ncbi:MAG: flagellar biosynthesis anti-sigma factor FlgM [Cycloclasticus sp.]|nr:flagellar biosynthesis anti-sigma factor FlgM [Cycloclasticus sp.]